MGCHHRDCTFCKILYGFAYSPVKGAGIGWTLKGQATPPVLHLPMVEGGRGRSVDQIFPQGTLQYYLSCQSKPAMSIKRDTLVIDSCIKASVNAHITVDLIGEPVSLGESVSLFVWVVWLQNVFTCGRLRLWCRPQAHRLAHLFVPLSVDEEVVSAGGGQGQGEGGGQLLGKDPAHADPAQSPPILGQPAPTRVVSRHHHCFHTHDVAVTGEGREERKRGTSVIVSVMGSCYCCMPPLTMAISPSWVNV